MQMIAKTHIFCRNLCVESPKDISCVRVRRAVGHLQLATTTIFNIMRFIYQKRVHIDRITPPPDRNQSRKIKIMKKKNKRDIAEIKSNKNRT